MHADGVFDCIDGPVGQQRVHIKIMDFAQTVAAQAERIGQITHTRLAGIQHVLPGVHGVTVAIGNHHVRQRGPIQDRPPLPGIVITQGMQDQAVLGVHADPERPLLPFHRVPIDPETRPLGLGNGNRFQIGPQRRLMAGLIPTALRRYGCHAMIFQMSHPSFGQIHMGNQTLERAGIAVVGLVFTHKSDRPGQTVGGVHAVGQGTAARPHIDLHPAHILDAAPSDRGLPGRVGFGELDRLHQVSPPKRHLSAAETLHLKQLSRRDIDPCVKTARLPPVGRFVHPKKAQHPSKRRAGGKGLDHILGRLYQTDAGEGERAAQLARAAEDGHAALNLAPAQRLQGMRREGLRVVCLYVLYGTGHAGFSFY